MLKALNLIGLYVADVARSVDFYKQLGFEVIKQSPTVADVGLGQFKVQFIAQETAKELGETYQKEAFGEPKGTGLYINIEVDNIDAYFADLKEKGITPSSEPRDWPWGHREFALRDPDRYKIVFYQPIKR